MSLSQLLPQVRERLAPVSETPGLDAQVVLAHILGVSRSWVLAHPEAVLTPAQTAQLSAWLARLESGEPLPYVLGYWEFYGLDLEINPAVLIPRPETELLVEDALHWLHENPRRRCGLDVGTGAGTIAVALAVHTPELHLTAGDLSFEALQVARRNASRHRVDRRIDFVMADLIPPLAARFDLITANLPYIPTPVLQGLKVFRSEPNLALDGGPEGLDAIQNLLNQSPQRLAPGGRLLLEIESSQGTEVRRLAAQVFPAAKVAVQQDLSGRDRLVIVQTHA